MISSMRNNMESNLYKYVLWVLLFSLVGGSAFVSIVNFFFPKKDPSIYAMVDGIAISRGAVQRAMLQEEEQIRLFKQKYGFDLSAQFNAMGSPEKRAFDALAKDVILRSTAEKGGLVYFSEEQMLNTLTNPQFLMQMLGMQVGSQLFDQSGNIQWDILEFVLKRQGVSLEQFEQTIRETLQKEMTLGLASRAFYIPDAMLKEAYLQSYVPRVFAYAMLNFDAYLKKAQQEKISQEELRAFYRQQNASGRVYWQPEKRAGIVWTFDPNKYDVQIKEKDVKLYYTRNRDKYLKDPAVFTVKTLRFDEKDYDKAQEVAQALAGDASSFDALFKKHKGFDGAISSDSKTDPVIMQTILELKKDGDLSGLVKSKDGWEIVKRISRKAPVYQKLESVQRDIKKSLKQEKFQRRFAFDAQSVTKRAKQDKKKFDDFAAKKKAAKKIIALTDGLNKNNDLRFVKELFAVKKIGGAKAMVDSNGYLVVLTEKEEARRIPFKDVEQRVKQDYAMQQARNALKKDLESAKDKVLSGQKFEDVAKTLKLSVKKTQPLVLDSKDAWEKLAKMGMPVEHMRDSVHVGDVVTSVNSADNAGFIVSLESIEKSDKKALSEKKAELLQKIQQEGVRFYIEAFIASLKENATIEIYKK